MGKTIEPQLYTPARVPKDAKDIPAYLDREFNRLARLLNNNPGLQGLFTERATAPSKVSDGMFVLADGTHWDPVGTGKWFVYYDSSSSSWKALNAATEIKYTNGSGKTVEDLFITAVTAGQVTADSIAAGSITTSKLAAGAVTASTIAAGTITATQIAANTITATNLNITTLSSITANMGTLTAGKIQDATGKYTIDLGALLETIKDGSGNSRVLIGNYTGSNYGVQVYSATGALIFDSIVGLYGAGLSPEISTSQIVDGAGLGNSAVWPISQLPVTVDGFGIVDALVDPGSVATDEQILAGYLDNSRAWIDHYGTEINSGDLCIGISGVNQLLTGSMVDIGSLIIIPNPGKSVYLSVKGSCSFRMPAGGSGTNSGSFQLLVSFDGGTTWNTSQPVQGTIPGVTSLQFAAPPLYFGVSGTPTGNIHIKMQVQQTAGSSSVRVDSAVPLISFSLRPNNSKYYLGSIALVASIPATSATTCKGTYPVTTCTATATISLNVSGGIYPYTYSNAVSAGTGAITSGATSSSYVVSDTETTSDGGTTHTTTTKSVVTDSQSYTGVTATSSGTTATLTIAAGHGIPLGGIFDVPSMSVSGYIKTGAVATAVTSTTVSYTTSGSGLAAGTGGVVNNVHVNTGNNVFTGTFKRIYSALHATLSVTNGSAICTASICGSCSASPTGLASVNISGGDGSNTKSWSVTSGTAVITSGATATTCHFSDTLSGGSSGSTSTSGIKCHVVDGHGLTADGTSYIDMTVTCFDNR